MSETIVGRVRIEKDLLPSEFHVSIQGNGRSLLVVAGQRSHIVNQDHSALLLGTLYELVRLEYPGTELPDVGPGPLALSERNTQLAKVLTAYETELPEVYQRLREAEAANVALTEKVALLEQEKQRLLDAVPA